MRLALLSLDPAPLDAATWLAAGKFDLRVGGKVELIFDKKSGSEPDFSRFCLIGP